MFIKVDSTLSFLMTFILKIPSKIDDVDSALTFMKVFLLCHCLENMPKINNCHDRIVERFQRVSSGSWSVMKKNQPLANSSKRSDLILIKSNGIVILEVGVTFENGLRVLDKLRNMKINKYQHIVKKFKKTYNDVSVEIIIVGVLGSWNFRNDRVCYRLCTKKHTTLCASRDIYCSY